MTPIIPIALFAYARPDHLRRTLDALCANDVPLLYVFSDGPATPEKEPAVDAVREILRSIDWCDVVLCERERNLGLGRSILTGVSSVLRKHEAVIVVEDDLICVPGTCRYLSAALCRYWDEERVMSVTGWTHPTITPSSVICQPYFDGRAECWVWGTWARAWRGMDTDAATLMRASASRGMDVYRYGADLPAMAEMELRKNIWAVRFLYLHILRGGLCLRPPHSMVEHIGFDEQATNAANGDDLLNPPLKQAPPIPDVWPWVAENPECVRLWQKACGNGRVGRTPFRWPRRAAGFARRVAVRAAACLGVSK